MRRARGARLRVLLLIKGLGAGGAERLLVDVVAGASRDQIEYEVAYVLRHADTLVPELQRLGVPVHCLGSAASWDLRWLGALHRVLHQGRFDVVHSHLPYTGAFAPLVVATLRPSRRPKVVYTEHSTWNRTATLTRALNRAAAHLDDAVVTVSRPVHESLPAPLRRRARVVVHGIDMTKVSSVCDRSSQRVTWHEALGVTGDDVVALTVANVRKEKGYDVLIRAAAALHGSPVRFVAVGGGPLEQWLQEEIRSMHVGPSFTYLGRRDGVMDLLAAADLFVLPSHFEGMPVALMEAMASGLPVVASAVGGILDVVDDGVEGLLVPPGDPAALAQAVRHLATDVELRARMAEASLRRAAAFDITRAVGELEELYDQLVAVGQT